MNTEMHVDGSKTGYVFTDWSLTVNIWPDTLHLIIVSYSSKWNMVKVLLRSLRLEIQYGKVCINNSSM